jgi:hypothetical protein
LPVCSRTTTTRKIQTTMCRVVRKICHIHDTLMKEYNACKSVGLQACSANKRTINILLRH